MRLRPVLACLLAFVLLTAIGRPVEAATSSARAPTGTWRLLKDSNGRVPKPGAVIELTLGNGTFTFKGVQPGETVEDRGTYSVGGRTITIEFKELDKGRQSGRFSVSNDTLVLPFQLMSDEPGWSMWMTPAALESFLAKVPRRPAGPESMPELLARELKVAEAFGNTSERAAIDQRARANAARYRGGVAEAYYAQGATFFLKGYYREAWYGFAKASVLQPANAVYLHNLAAVLQEIGSSQDARTILEWVTRNYPNLDPPWGSLGVACIGLKDAACARSALARARSLAPENGLYDYAMGRLLDSEGKQAEAQNYYRTAWNKGYGGSGNEGGRSGGGR